MRVYKSLIRRNWPCALSLLSESVWELDQNVKNATFRAAADESFCNLKICCGIYSNPKRFQRGF